MGSYCTGSPERPAIGVIHLQYSDIAFYFEHNRISKILRLDQSKRAKSVVGKSRPRTCENCTNFSVSVPCLPSSLSFSPFLSIRPGARSAAPPPALLDRPARPVRTRGSRITHGRSSARPPARPPPLCLRVGSEVRQPHEPHQPRRRPERRRTARAPGHRQATHLPALHRASCISPVALPRSRAFRPPPVSPALARQSHAPKHKRERDRCGDVVVSRRVRGTMGVIRPSEDRSATRHPPEGPCPQA